MGGCGARADQTAKACDDVDDRARLVGEDVQPTGLLRQSERCDDQAKGGEGLTQKRFVAILRRVLVDDDGRR